MMLVGEEIQGNLMQILRMIITTVSHLIELVYFVSQIPRSVLLSKWTKLDLNKQNKTKCTYMCSCLSVYSSASPFTTRWIFESQHVPSKRLVMTSWWPASVQRAWGGHRVNESQGQCKQLNGEVQRGNRGVDWKGVWMKLQKWWQDCQFLGKIVGFSDV